MILTLNENLKEAYYKPRPKDDLIATLSNVKWDYRDKKNYKGQIKVQQLFPIENNMDGDFSHKNYIEYLLGAWDSHSGIVVSPDIIWYTLQCELTSLVATNSDTYRSLFTTSDKKEEVIVYSDSMTVMPLDTLVNALKKKIPSEIGAFLPEFSTSSQRAILARLAAFADMVSPYYSYGMFCCGFPCIDVRGDKADWGKLRACWNSIGKLFTKHQNYVAQVDAILEKICLSLDDADFWKNMFSLDACGSGHQYFVRGWFEKLLEHPPDFKMPENYPSHISTVAYTQVNIKVDYEMKQGLISSKKDGVFMIPEFAHIIYRKEKQPVITDA